MVDYKQFGRYKVTRDGKIYGLNGNLMKIFLDQDGYEVVGLRDDHYKKHLVKVHRLVATRYIPTNDYTMTVNHKDGNKTNNDVNNLEWMSNSDNLRHSWKTLNRKHVTKHIRNSKGEIFESAKEAIRNTCSTCAQEHRYMIPLPRSSQAFLMNILIVILLHSFWKHNSSNFLNPIT